jgi:hypothetical protein
VLNDYVLLEVGYSHMEEGTGYLTNVALTPDLIIFWHHYDGTAGVQMELLWWQWGAVLLGRLHLQEQEPCSRIQGNNISDSHLKTSVNSFKSPFPILCTMPIVWYKIYNLYI